VSRSLCVGADVGMGPFEAGTSGCGYCSCRVLILAHQPPGGVQAASVASIKGIKGTDTLSLADLSRRSVCPS
jgi:hypothetical protein